MSCKVIDEEFVMHSNNDNIEIMINDKVDEVLEVSITYFQISNWAKNINER